MSPLSPSAAAGSSAGPEQLRPQLLSQEEMRARFGRDGRSIRPQTTSPVPDARPNLPAHGPEQAFERRESQLESVRRGNSVVKGKFGLVPEPGPLPVALATLGRLHSVRQT